MSVILDPTFTTEDHCYTDHAGNVVPSVTELIGQYWPIDRRFYTENGTNRGTQVHAASAVIDSGLFTVGAFAGTAEEPYLKAWEKFKRDCVHEIIWREQKFLVEELGYAGTVDIIATTKYGKVGVFDLKSGKLEAWHELQQGAYSLAARLAGIGVDLIATVQLKKNEEYKLVTHNLEQALLAWQSLIRWHNYRKAKKT